MPGLYHTTHSAATLAWLARSLGSTTLLSLSLSLSDCQTPRARISLILHLHHHSLWFSQVGTRATLRMACPHCLNCTHLVALVAHYNCNSASHRTQPSGGGKRSISRRASSCRPVRRAAASAHTQSGTVLSLLPCSGGARCGFEPPTSPPADAGSTGCQPPLFDCKGFGFVCTSVRARNAVAARW